MVTQRDNTGNLKTYNDLFEGLEPGESVGGGGRWHRADPPRSGSA